MRTDIVLSIDKQRLCSRGSGVDAMCGAQVAARTRAACAAAWRTRGRSGRCAGAATRSTCGATRPRSSSARAATAGSASCSTASSPPCTPAAAPSTRPTTPVSARLISNTSPSYLQKLININKYTSCINFILNTYNLLQVNYLLNTNCVLIDFKSISQKNLGHSQTILL